MGRTAIRIDKATSAVACLVLLTLLWDAASAAEPCGPSEAVARVASSEGTITLNGRNASRNALICVDDVVRVGHRSRAAIVFLQNENVLRLDQDTQLRVLPSSTIDRSLLDMLEGAIHFFSPKPRSLNIRTPFLNASVEGTEFLVRVADERTSATVFKGRIVAANDKGELTLASGESAVAARDQAPTAQLIARPRDAVQWALYYLPVFAVPPGGDRDAPAAADALRKADMTLSDGDIVGALDALDTMPGPARDAEYWFYRANLLLVIGRVAEAQTAIEQGAALSPDNAAAHALQTVIDVAHNRRQQALENGRRAVASDPTSSAAKIALSYALQAGFRLQAARDALLEAVKAQPEDSLAWARLAELQLSLGDLGAASEAAGRATQSLNARPSRIGEARVRTTEGLIALFRIRLEEAEAAFDRALELNSQDPLTHLGLALAKIRSGRLEAGREDLATAVALGLNDALLRSYLGKAYFDEKRDSLAARQFAAAKELDPNDPTPWFYDAIRKQTRNRPVEALRDLETSIALNGNRAVYRSRFLLDQDLAARSAGLGRIYGDLGFEQRALVEGWKSVRTAPADFSGHRLLADTYASLPRHEVARVSELWQSQLLQPLNIAPVQPQLAETNLFVLQGAGPSRPSFNEFNPMFARNRIAFRGDGVAGSNDTWGDDLILSGIHNRFSFSIGQYHFESDGFRPNNDQEQDIGNLFLQAALSPATSVLAEYRRSDIEQGDMELRFTEFFTPDIRQKEDVETVRVGLRHDFAPHSTLIASLTRQDGDLDTRIPGFLRLSTDVDNYVAEARYLHRWNRWHMTAGAWYVNEEGTTREEFFGFPTITDEESRHFNAYLYSYPQVGETVEMTVGASADFTGGDVTDTERFNPKFGVTWEPSPEIRVRAAAFSGMQRPFISMQKIDPSLEPTQVAGFNQVFFDGEGDEAERYGLGLDRKLSDDLYVGAEASLRDVEVLINIAPQEFVRRDWEERIGRAYLYWSLNAHWALTGEYLYEWFERESEGGLTGSEQFAELRTHRLPIGARYFHPSGITATAVATYVDQRGDFTDSGSPDLSIVPGEDDFWVVDASLSYRLPKRYGVVSLEVKNLFDEDFRFQDTDPGNPRILPDRFFMFKLAVSL